MWPIHEASRLGKDYFPENLSIVRLTKFVTVKGDKSMLRFEFLVDSVGYLSVRDLA